MTEAAVEARSARKEYGAGDKKVRALNDVSLVINKGEFFTLLGPSGCGKTTLLRLIAGFESPTSGMILLGARDISTMAPYDRPVNTVFQSYALFPHLSVADNIGFGLTMQGTPKAQVDARVAEMLALVKLEAFADRKPQQLSGGQQQRVALARALAPAPEVLLLDEPLSALDLKLRKEMQLELKRLQTETGITFVFVTHDQEEALTLSDRIAVMAEGRVLQIDSPTGLYERPSSRRVASFIGTMNFFDATVSGVNGTSVEVAADGLGTLRLDRRETAVAEGDRVQVAIRPEKLGISDSQPEGAGGRIQGTLENSAYLGERSHHYVRLEGLEKPVAVSAQNKENAIATADKARPIWLSWNEESLVLIAGD